MVKNCKMAWKCMVYPWKMYKLGILYENSLNLVSLETKKIDLIELKGLNTIFKAVIELMHTSGKGWNLAHIRV